MQVVDSFHLRIISPHSTGLKTIVNSKMKFSKLNCSLFTTWFVFTILQLVNHASVDAQSDKLVVCYVRSWALYRETFPFGVSNIDPTLCTHLVYLYAGLTDTADDIRSRIPHIDLANNNGNDMYRKMTALKIKNPQLKVLLCVGGSGEDKKFSRLSRSDNKRKDFAKKAVSFLRQYGFDGLDLYWFSPESDEDKQNLVLLLQELRKDFAVNNLLLTVIVRESKEIIERGFNIQGIAQHVDWLNINLFNYHTPRDSKFGIHAPMNSVDENNIKFTVDYILDKGVPANKIVFRFGVHGMGFTGVDNAGNFGGAIQGLYDDDRGFLTFFEICEYLDSGWTSVWDDKSSTPIAYKNNDKISYDDPKSLKIKASFAVQKKVLGVGFASLDSDDFQGNCKLPGSGNKDHKYPLLKAVRSALNDNSSDSQNSNSSVKVSVVIHEF